MTFYCWTYVSSYYSNYFALTDSLSDWNWWETPEQLTVLVCECSGPGRSGMTAVRVWMPDSIVLVNTLGLARRRIRIMSARHSSKKVSKFGGIYMQFPIL